MAGLQDNMLGLDYGYGVEAPEHDAPVGLDERFLRKLMAASADRAQGEATEDGAPRSHFKSVSDMRPQIDAETQRLGLANIRGRAVNDAYGRDNSAIRARNFGLNPGAGTPLEGPINQWARAAGTGRNPGPPGRPVGNLITGQVDVDHGEPIRGHTPAPMGGWAHPGVAEIPMAETGRSARLRTPALSGTSPEETGKPPVATTQHGKMVWDGQRWMWHPAPIEVGMTPGAGRPASAQAQQLMGDQGGPAPAPGAPQPSPEEAAAAARERDLEPQGPPPKDIPWGERAAIKPGDAPPPLAQAPFGSEGPGEAQATPANMARFDRPNAPPAATPGITLNDVVGGIAGVAQRAADWEPVPQQDFNATDAAERGAHGDTGGGGVPGATGAVKKEWNPAADQAGAAPPRPAENELPGQVITGRAASNAINVDFPAGPAQPASPANSRLDSLTRALDAFQAAGVQEAGGRRAQFTPEQQRLHRQLLSPANVQRTLGPMIANAKTPEELVQAEALLHRAHNAQQQAPGAAAPARGRGRGRGQGQAQVSSEISGLADQIIQKRHDLQVAHAQGIQAEHFGRTRDEAERHNRQMEDIGGQRAQEAQTAQTERARHDREQENMRRRANGEAPLEVDERLAAINDPEAPAEIVKRLSDELRQMGYDAHGRALQTGR